MHAPLGEGVGDSVGVDVEVDVTMALDVILTVGVTVDVTVTVEHCAPSTDGVLIAIEVASLDNCCVVLLASDVVVGDSDILDTCDIEMTIE